MFLKEKFLSMIIIHRKFCYFIRLRDYIDSFHHQKHFCQLLFAIGISFLIYKNDSLLQIISYLIIILFHLVFNYPFSLKKFSSYQFY